MDLLGLTNYWLSILIMMLGLYGVLSRPNLLKKAIALGMFQTGVFLFYVSMGASQGPEGEAAQPPIWSLEEDGSKTEGPYDNPLPHVLMLTAIVVSVSTLAVAVALIVNIHREFGTIEEDEIREAHRQAEGGS